MNLNQHLETVNTRYKSGISREHAYRRDLEELIRELVSGVEITNEPANLTDCGNPDYVVTKGKAPIGYIEAKDVGKDLNHKQYKEFLKIDFPRVPHPTDTDKFRQLVQLGGELRQIHLLESPTVEHFITTYPVDGDNNITRKMPTKSSVTSRHPKRPVASGLTTSNISTISRSLHGNFTSASTSPPRYGSRSVMGTRSTSPTSSTTRKSSSPSPKPTAL